MSEYRKVIYESYHSNQVNKNSADYQTLLEQQSYYYLKEIVPYLPENKDSSIIDIGCGFGSFIKAAKDAKYNKLKGIDISPEQVKVASDLGLSEVKLMSVDLWFDTEELVDCAVGIDIIEHFTKDELINFLMKLKKSIRPGGRVVFRTPNMDTPFSSVYAFADYSHEVFLNKSSALQLMSSCGFKEIEIRESMILNRSKFKEIFRKFLWWSVRLIYKLILFSTGRTWTDVTFSPNLIIVAKV